MADQDRIIDKIRKCLKLGTNEGATEGERDNAMRQAYALMKRHNLDMAQLEASTGEVDSTEPRLEHDATFYGRPWARKICVAVGELFFCSYLYVPGSDAKQTRHSWIGRKSNAITAAEISRYVVESIQKEARKRARDAGAGNEYRRAFALGAAGTIHQRVNEMLEEARKPAPDAPIVVDTKGAAQSTALVIINLYKGEADANQQFITSKYPRLRGGRSGKGIESYDAFHGGREYGKSVSLNRQVGDSRIKGQLK